MFFSFTLCYMCGDQKQNVTCVAFVFVTCIADIQTWRGHADSILITSLSQKEMPNQWVLVL